MIRFKNCKVMDMCDKCNIETKEVWVDGQIISFVGVPTDEQLKNTVFEKEYDLEGNLVMPSFKNAHTHSAMTFARSYADDLPLHDWLFNKIFPLEEKLTLENVYWFTKLAILEYLTSGVTACFDMYFMLDSYIKAVDECGIRSVMCSGISGNNRDEIKRLEDDFLAYRNTSDRINFQLGFHAVYTSSYEYMEEVARLAEKYKVPVGVHNSETDFEVKSCIEKYGKTPTALFDSLGIYNYGGQGFHCVHMSDEDIEIFKKRNVSVVTCPASNLKLASGIAPIEKMHNAGINIAIGTDGPASNNCLDMFREMFLTTALQKYYNNDAASCAADEVLRMATVNGAKAFGLDNCDTLAVGKQADLIVIDLNQPNMHPFHNIAKNIVYSGSKQNVKLTMCAGKVLYENGIYYINEDVNRIYSRCQELCEDFKK